MTDSDQLEYPRVVFKMIQSNRLLSPVIKQTGRMHQLLLLLKLNINMPLSCSCQKKKQTNKKKLLQTFTTITNSL